MNYILSYLSAFVFAIAGILLGATVIPSEPTLLIVLTSLSILPLFLLIFNVIAAKISVKKIRQTNVEDMNTYMQSHRKEAEETSRVLLLKLQHLRRTALALNLTVAFFAILSAVLAGLLFFVNKHLAIICHVYSYFLFCTVFSRIYKDEKIVIGEKALCLSQSDYPRIYDSAYRAAKKLGCDKEIMIVLSSDCNATIYKDTNRYILEIGIILLNIMSEEELYCIFLHEFSHISDKHSAGIKEFKYSNWLSGKLDKSKALYPVANLLIYFDLKYSFNHMIYQYATSVVDETESDTDMARHGDPKTAASALIKLHYYTMYTWESGVEDEVPPYASEVLSADYYTVIITKLKNAIEKRHSYWDSLIPIEILANNATHPTMKMRLETLGVNEVRTVEDNSSSEYLAELKKALDYMEKEAYDLRKESFEEDRKAFYLEPLERVTKWENQGKPVTADNYMDIVSALQQLGRYKEAEELCDRAIAELNESSSRHAYYIKGCAMLYRHDDNGIELIYRSMDNPNYIDAGLNLIGTFCCITGREKELKEYRERAPKLAQKVIDTTSKADFLSKDDVLVRENLPDGMLEDILNFIHSVDNNVIHDIYLVRKTISEDFFTSAFIIRFFGETEEEKYEIMHKIFCYLDAYPIDWQFSLFDYSELVNVKVESIEGSLVYSKINEEEE